jgi:glycine hydroxymethyltransferase
VIDFQRFRAIADEVGAYLFADIAHIAGLVVAGEHPTSIGHAHITTTTTHKTLRGPRAGLILCGEDHAKAVDKTVFPGMQGGPLMHVIAGKAVAFLEAMQPSFKSYARQVIANARAMAAALQERGFPVISGGTDNHLFLIDVGSRDISGRKAERILDTVGISANRNTIPGDTRPPTQASGLRIGTPAMTTRGFSERESVAVADMIARVLDAPEDATVLERVRADVLELTVEFPVPGTTPSEVPVSR